MSMPDLVSKITTCSVIDHQGAYTVFGAKKYCTYNHITGKTVKYPEVHPYFGKHIFLSGNRLLVEGGGDSMYHLISMEEGVVKASVSAPRKRRMRAWRFALSTDGATAYDLWELDDRQYLAIFTLEPFSVRLAELKLNLRVAADLLCSADNELLLLQTQVDSDGEGNWSCAQIVSVNAGGELCETKVIHEWRRPLSFMPFKTDGRFVLHRNLTVLDLMTGASFSLLENTEVPFTQENGPTYCKYYPESGLLQLYNGREDTFVDCRSRKIVAKYFTGHEAYYGALIKGKYWTGTKKGIIAKDFPLFEEIPPVTLSERLGRN